jgi:protoheme IX farnesyltransferase
MDYIALTKPRLNSLVLMTTGVAYYLGSRGTFELIAFVNTLLGTALVAGGAAALNQVAECEPDGLMERTRLRPIPDRRLESREGRLLGVGLAGAGLLILLFGTPLVATVLALATLVIYVAIYTPLKKRTSWAIAIGAIPGALPAALGWAAARGTVNIEGWILFGIVFLWQIPHFLSIAWMYREDFKRAEFLFLPVLDPSGDRTTRHMIAFIALLIPVSVTPTWIGLAEFSYVTGAVLLGIGFLMLAIRFAIARTVTSARWLFIGSIIYLPLLFGLLMLTQINGA